MHFRFSRRAVCGTNVSADEQFVEQTFQQTSSLWNMLFSRRVVCGTYVSATRDVKCCTSISADDSCWNHIVVRMSSSRVTQARRPTHIKMIPQTSLGYVAQVNSKTSLRAKRKLGSLVIGQSSIIETSSLNRSPEISAWMSTIEYTSVFDDPEHTSVFDDPEHTSVFGDPEHTSVFDDPEYTSVFGDPEHTSVFYDPEHTSVFGDSEHTSVFGDS
ncbi:hypothetical protein BgiBS90_018514 [Biomphalaria glabrata]|nr:hypothetical protein BgiBS90_018514 [Biomphalaria glabrata]